MAENTIYDCDADLLAALGGTSGSQPLTIKQRGTLFNQSGIPISARTFKTSLGCRGYGSSAHFDTTANFTHVTAQTVDGDFTHVRAVFENFNTTPLTIGAVCVSAPTLIDNGASNTWVPLYFNDPTLATKQPTNAFNTGTSTRTVTVPAGYGAGGQRIASYAYSDWAALSSAARTDGGSGYLIVGRTWVTSASTVKQMSSAQAAAYVTAGSTVGWASNADGTGAFVTSPNANPKTPSTGGGFVTVPAYYEYLRASTRGVKILASGDSLMSGYDGSAFATSWVDQSVKSISVPTTGPIDITNISFSGNSMYAICQRAINAMNWIHPDIIVLPVYSPNDIGSNATSAYIGWEMVLNVVNEAMRLGVIPVLVTGMPSNLSTAIDAARININTYARQMFPNNIIDLDLMMTNGATPARLNSTYNSGDNVHLNAAGYTQIATGIGMSVPNASTRLSTIINNNLI